ncbi:GNAT family N-acetyltransferase [Virgibacillus halodenitrificans]|uniref:GNAT family N-acetyltransferase n=1 Tax=Virgibacillus halodenitrificans TaxID=1482 RepID=UPI00045CDCBA|nr:GNAT family N-acetyltransferase [Virgibacillus halodenitrificans]MCG1027261.1 GNAT family N-acetyltransferase [Virgibacillus halodenitrificans]CDQ31194.1 acetyltransferase [Virgibacillus halodenitrificans]
MKLVKWNTIYLQQLVDLWEKELGTDFPMRTELFKQNSFQDENVSWEGSQIAINDADEVIGFIIAKKWQEATSVSMPTSTGWIQVIVVAKQYQNKGIGSRLLTHAEKVFRDEGMGTILLGRDPWHYFPGIPENNAKAKQWFEAKGYKMYVQEHDMIKAYDANEEIEEPNTSDVTFTILAYEEKDEFLTFLNRCFPGRWEYEALKYFEQGGNGREFIVMKKQGNIIGFCRINDSRSLSIAQNVYWAPLFKEELGGIGPLGVDDAERGQGYGLTIVKAGIAELRRRDIYRIVIDWTGLVTFYKKLGYGVWKSYDSYEKSLHVRRG